MSGLHSRIDFSGTTGTDYGYLPATGRIKHGQTSTGE
jgi:hypothetical protein